MTPRELKRFREDQCMSQLDFATWIGVASARTVRKWEDGEADIPGSVERLIWVLERSASARAALDLFPLD